MRNILLILFLALFSSCSKESNQIEEALHSDAQKIKTVFDSIEQYEVQILFTEVKKEGEKITFEDFEFNVDSNTYFYPASTVKFPMAVFALETLNQFPDDDMNSTLSIEGDSIKTTVKKEIEKIFAVSDNDAYNRLYEFVKKDQANNRLQELNLKGQFSHRLSIPNSAALVSKSYNLGDSLNFTKVSSEIQDSIIPLKMNAIKKGIGYTKGDSLITTPMNFSQKNYLPIRTLHQMMKRLVFPELFETNERFQVSESQRKQLLEIMKKTPRELRYDEEEYYDGYVKFFLLGDHKNRIPEHIEIANKVGYAYGYLTDCAYIKDKKKRKEYIITATIHVNKNQIYNDGIYEYETIGIPFLAELGRKLVSLDEN